MERKAKMQVGVLIPAIIGPQVWYFNYQMEALILLLYLI
jgi:hypothetical protein